MATAENVEGHKSYFYDSTPRIMSTTTVTSIQSQDDDSSILEMGKDMDSLLTLFGHVE